MSEGLLGSLIGSSPGTFAATTADQQVLAANSNREGLCVTNSSNNTARVSLGLGKAAVLDNAFTLGPGMSWDGCVSGKLWTGALHVIASAACTLGVEEA